MINESVTSDLATFIIIVTGIALNVPFGDDETSISQRIIDHLEKVIEIIKNI